MSHPSPARTRKGEEAPMEVGQTGMADGKTEDLTMEQVFQWMLEDEALAGHALCKGFKLMWSKEVAGKLVMERENLKVRSNDMQLPAYLKVHRRVMLREQKWLSVCRELGS